MVGADDIQLLPLSCPGDESLELRVGSHNRGHECAASYCTIMYVIRK